MSHTIHICAEYEPEEINKNTVGPYAPSLCGRPYQKEHIGEPFTADWKGTQAVPFSVVDKLLERPVFVLCDVCASIAKKDAAAKKK